MEKSHISQALVPGLNYTRGLLLDGPQTCVVGNLSLGLSPMASVSSSLWSFFQSCCLCGLQSHCHLVSVLSLSQETAAPDWTPQTDHGPGSAPWWGCRWSMDRHRFQYVALPSMVRSSRAVPRGAGKGLHGPWLPPLQEKAADTRPEDVYFANHQA